VTKIDYFSHLMQVIPNTSRTTEAENLSIAGIESETLLSFVNLHTKTIDQQKRIVLAVDNKFSIDNLPNPAQDDRNYSGIINLRKANDIFSITAFFCAVNRRLEKGGKAIICVETAQLRKERLLKKFPPILNTVYYSFDYLGKRVAPKLPILRNIYQFLTAGRNRVLSSVEIMGRLVYCGFAIIETKTIDGLLYVVAEKEVHKSFVPKKNYGFLVKMERSGQYGKPIMVYKVRTMYAYSEYLQDYIYQQNQLAEGGKFKDDFRINLMGKLLRKLWLDEIPMFYNWLKGEVKLVGVRPLSQHYLNLYSEELKERRLNFKPGLIPPYYADLPKTIDEIMASEVRYFDAYDQHPITTDLNYLLKAIANILFKNARSK
jgi:lipopolysaccharide/colanic/teichoic acid biosynthesis glycosyltransferase